MTDALCVDQADGKPVGGRKPLSLTGGLLPQITNAKALLEPKMSANEAVGSENRRSETSLLEGLLVPGHARQRFAGFLQT